MTSTQSNGSRAYLFSIVLVAVIGGLLFGYDTAVVSGAEQALDDFFRTAKDFTYTAWMHGFTASSALIGCVIGGAISGVLAARLGRKPLLMIGSTGMMIGMAVLAALSFTDTIGLGALIFIIIYTASFMMSWGPICWVLISEIFPNTIRSQAVAIAVAAQWISNFLVSATFPSLSGWSVGGTYCIYAVMSLLSALFVWKMVPETKGKTLEQMSALWRGRK